MALTQQGTQRIEVIVTKQGTSETVGANETDTSDASNSSSETTDNNGGGLSTRTKRIITTNATHALSTLKQVFSLSAGYAHSGLGYRSGDQSYQEQVERTYEILDDTTNVISNVIRGGVYGAWGGPVGVVVGIGTAALSSAASLGVKYASRQREYNYEVFKENNAVQYNRTRAGINEVTGRLR